MTDSEQLYIDCRSAFPDANVSVRFGGRLLVGTRVPETRGLTLEGGSGTLTVLGSVRLLCREIGPTHPVKGDAISVLNASSGNWEALTVGDTRYDHAKATVLVAYMDQTT
jgi:hypothetical protein